jgi:hypothetical protein
MTEATVLDFEIIVLDQYLRLMQLIESRKRASGLLDFHDEERAMLNPTLPTPEHFIWREKFIATYRYQQMRIVQDQVQLLSTALIILREVSVRGEQTYKDVIRSHALLGEQNLRHIMHIRKYLKSLFTANSF